MTTPIVLYLGPSMLDGTPIVCLATINSKNRKTGALVQTWIVRADVSPVAAYKAGADSAVCGQCPRRHSLGGDCYVMVANAPHAAWKLWGRSGRPGENWSDESQICSPGPSWGTLTSGARWSHTSRPRAQSRVTRGSGATSALPGTAITSWRALTASRTQTMRER